MALLKRLMWKQGVLLYGIPLKKELMRLNQLGLKFSFYYLSSFRSLFLTTPDIFMLARSIILQFGNDYIYLMI